MKRLFLLPLLFLSLAQAETIRCKVVGILDGDTIKCLTENEKQIKIRLFQIDAPESGQRYGEKAKNALSDMIFNQYVDIETHGRDKYNRTLGTIYTMGMYSCYPDGDSRNASSDCGCMYDNALSMIQQGYAWYYPFDKKNSEYIQAEKEARGAKRGLWTDPNPVPPWVYRKMGHQKNKKQADRILEQYRRKNSY